MIRLLVYALLIFLGYRYIKKVWLPRPPQVHGRDEVGPEIASEGVGTMRQDPYCGIYFAETEGVSGVIDGQRLWFCSPQCHEKFLASRKEPG